MIDWEALYQADDTPWDKGAPAPPCSSGWTVSRRRPDEFRSGMRLRTRRPRAGCCLPGAEVLGLDLAESAVQRASAFPTGAGVKCRRGDFFALPSVTSSTGSSNTPASARSILPNDRPTCTPRREH